MTATDRKTVEALPHTEPRDTDDFHAGVDYAMELMCKFLRVDPCSFSWDAATEEFEGDIVSVIGNMFFAGFGEDESPETLRALLAERDQLKAENERLREALEVYADNCDATETTPCGYEGNMCCMTARAALTPHTPAETG